MPYEVTIPFVKIRRLRDVQLPRYATPGAAGLDLHAAETLTLLSGRRALVRTGIAIELPDGYEGQVRPRSGLALRHGVTVLNAPGTIDADYRSEIGVLLINFGDTAHTITQGDRIAQLVVCRAPQAVLIEVDELESTGRGGFGSTGA